MNTVKDEEPIAAPNLKLRGVSKSFDGERVLDGLDLSVSEGEYVVVLGPSGCGKSTLLQIIAGLVPLDAGTVEFALQSLGRVAPKDRDVAFLFQDDRLYPHWTLRQNLRIAMDRSPVKSSGNDVMSELARRLGIDGLLERRPDEVSGGQLRRAALVKALLRQPAVCLLDEPLSAIDMMLREDLIALLADYPRDRGSSLSQTSILHVTHDGEEAMRLADRIVVLGSGRVLQSGTPESIYRSPCSLEVAKAIGTPPANLIPLRWLRSVFASSYEAILQSLPGCDETSFLVLRPESVEITDQSVGNDQVTVVSEDAWNVTASVISSRFVEGRWLTRLAPVAEPGTVWTFATRHRPGTIGKNVVARIPLCDLVAVPGATGCTA